MSHELALSATPKHASTKSIESAQRKLRGSSGDIGPKKTEEPFEEKRPSTPMTESKRRVVRFSETENNFKQFLGIKKRSISVDETQVRDEVAMDD